MASLAPLIKTGKTVFNINEIAGLWDTTYNSAKTMVTRKVKVDDLYRIKPGVVSFDENYDRFEFGCKMVTGSYISLYSVLKEEGVIFQEFNTIYLVGERAREICADGMRYQYHRIKNLLYFEKGVFFRLRYSIASVERAILDCFSIFDTDYSDFNLSKFNKNLFLELKPFYSKRVQKKADQFLKHFDL